jgi:hypothetical protein
VLQVIAHVTDRPPRGALTCDDASTLPHPTPGHPRDEPDITLIRGYVAWRYLSAPETGSRRAALSHKQRGRRVIICRKRLWGILAVRAISPFVRIDSGRIAYRVHPRFLLPVSPVPVSILRSHFSHSFLFLSGYVYPVPVSRFPFPFPVSRFPFPFPFPFLTVRQLVSMLRLPHNEKTRPASGGTLTGR